ncbi:dual specificity protein kinase yak1 [Globomyces sp. JEL0801]|nr:dual specificity protein kinase yak1 [Globomyces sp. JEL0801]
MSKQEYWSWDQNTAKDRDEPSHQDTVNYSFNQEAVRNLHISPANSLVLPLQKKKNFHRNQANPAVLPEPSDLAISDSSLMGFRPYKNNPESPPPDNTDSVIILAVYFVDNQKIISPINNPRRALTKPSAPVHNDGVDNQDYDYILYVNDILGSGTFGQVVKCQNIKTKDLVALKVIKNKPAYYNQSLVEVAILDLINKKYDPKGNHHLVRMKDSFVFKNHLCIAFEMLSVNLYELIKQNQFRGLSTNLIRVFVTQILDALTVLYKAKLIHCDLKPENILLKTLESPSIKVIDLGSACHENQTVYTYIQSRFYRSPEILLGLSYSSSIDVWSLGCIAAELFLGLPLFPGSSEYNQLSRIVELLGNPPNHMCEKGKSGSQYFNRHVSNDNKVSYSLKSMEQYMKDQATTNEKPSKRYFKGNTLSEIINAYPIMRKGLTAKEIEMEMQSRRTFIDFLSGLLRMNPMERWTPHQAMQHPFITQKPFTEPYVPQVSPSKPLQQSYSHNDIRNGRNRASTTLNPSSQQFETEDVHMAPLSPLAPSKSQQMSRRKSQQSGPIKDLPYSSMMGVIPSSGNKSQESRMHQVVGTFSEFQINPMIPSSLPESSPLSRSQDFGSPNVNVPYGQSLSNSNAFPVRKAKSHFSIGEGQHYGSPGFNTMYYGDESFTEEGHPRYGNDGERIRLPSRMPSAATSVDWEMFRDYNGGSSLAGSYVGSRQSSVMDMHINTFNDGSRRMSQSIASPNQTRSFGFQGRRFGSFSNESLLDGDRGAYGKSNDYLRPNQSQESFIMNMVNSGQSPSMTGAFNNFSIGSPQGGQGFGKSNKKVKSVPSLGDTLEGSAGRRHSITAQQQQQTQSPRFSGLGSSRRPSLLDLDASSLLPPTGTNRSRNGSIQNDYYYNSDFPNNSQHLPNNTDSQPSPLNQSTQSQHSTSRPIDLPHSRHGSRDKSHYPRED